MTEPFLGEIRIFAGNFAPAGWSLCDGQLLSIFESTALFSLLGTTYGGDGRTTFGLPDLRGRVPLHHGNGPGLSSYRLGQKSGAETVALSTNQLPAHKHELQASTDPAQPTADPVDDMVGDGGDIRFYSAPASGNPVAMSSQAVANTGENQEHANMAPFLAVHFIIARFGIFPSRS